MTQERVHQHLETANEILSQMVDELIQAGDGVHRCPLLLKQVRQELEVVSSHMTVQVEDERGQRILGQIRSRMARVQVLLDSATLLYCGSLYAAPLRTGFYTADGGADSITAQGRLRIEA